MNVLQEKLEINDISKEIFVSHLLYFTTFNIFD